MGNENFIGDGEEVDVPRPRRFSTLEGPVRRRSLTYQNEKPRMPLGRITLAILFIADLLFVHGYFIADYLVPRWHDVVSGAWTAIIFVGAVGSAWQFIRPLFKMK